MKFSHKEDIISRPTIRKTLDSNLQEMKQVLTTKMLHINRSSRRLGWLWAYYSEIAQLKDENKWIPREQDVKSGSSFSAWHLVRDFETLDMKNTHDDQEVRLICL